MEITSIALSFLKGLFPPGQGATIGVDFLIKTVEIDGEKVKVSHILIIIPLQNFTLYLFFSYHS